VAEVTVGQRPVSLLLSGSRLWIASTAGSPRLERVDAARMVRARRPPRIGEGASDLLEYRDTLWVAAIGRQAVLRLHPRTGRPVAPPLPVGGEPRVLAAGHGSVWVAERRLREDRLMRFDARTGALLATQILREGISDMEHTSGTLWVLGRLEPKLMKFRAKTLERGRALAVGADPRRMKMTRRYVWVALHGDDSLARVDRRTDRVTTISTCNKPYGIDVHAGIVWVACFGDGAVARVNARTRRSIRGLIQVGVNPIGLLATRDAVWVTGADDGTVSRISLRNSSSAPGAAG
jgi:streptogramin lyase